MDDAAKKLEKLGPTKYGALAFTALTRLGEATAKEVHEESGVPRSNVYGALDRLADRGLVETSGSRPTVYRAVEPEEAMDRLKRLRRSEEREALQTLKKAYTESRKESKGGVWTITGERNVVERGREIIRASREKVWIIDYPGVVADLEPELSETAAETRVVTTAEVDVDTRPFPDDFAHPIRMNGFVVIGDSEMLVSFETEDGRRGIFSDSPGMMQLFETFFRFRLKRAGSDPESITSGAAD
ncbi:MAG: HTH-type sugar sensing transcriptional regulator TrmBL1 [Methanonatronarchaeales archaeon]|nr:HTH-type sugar sensing transcriptional regulator TrmBL1 [Methanonatronarchaeales archaeon]